jgi:hypothetical protein
MSSSLNQAIRWFLPVLAVLAIVATLTPSPWWATDKDLYERMSREWLIPGCSDIHCFRPLVSVTLGLLPGPSSFKWLAYAVICEAGAATLMGLWVSRLGASARTSTMVVWLTALGSGSLYTLFDPHTSDPLMHLIGPAVMLAWVDGRFAAAIAFSVAGILAKEFAAVPIAVITATLALRGRWREFRIAAAGTAGAVALWAAWQVVARVALGYGNGLTHSADFASGGFLVFWMMNISSMLVIASLAMAYGALWLLWPAGLWGGTTEIRQLTFAALPPMLVFFALQQPERALWNFAVIVMPAVAVVLDRIPPILGWAVVGGQMLLNLRFGAQLTFMPSARILFAVTVLIAVIAVWQGRASAARTGAS